MGRENELREAAKDGNIAKLEALLSVKKSAFMSSLRKGININCQDESGNTALHIAALNGKMEAVVYLLQNDASANIPDVSGNYPLHLAAFNGHHEVANTLINQGPSRANVIEQNLVGDTALHIAAQFGHTQVVQILLECHADGNMRNKNQESPLDLAAKFGRLSTVRVLVLWDQSLVRSSCLKHSPLHLSARHGHTSVMTTLLDFGMSVNVMSDLGTALHEAALFGKVDAVRLLLNRGVDVNARNSDDRNVLDLLVEVPSERAHEITTLIYEQSHMMPIAQSARSKSMSFVTEDQAQAVGRPQKTDITSDTYSQVGGPMRSLTVSEKRPDKSPYTCVEYPRRSESTSLLEASISPAPSEITQDEIFNDEFLRDARPVEIPSESGLPPAKPKRIALETMTRTAEPNAYEEHHVAGIDAVHTNTQQQANTGPEQRQTSSVYDIVPPPSRKPAGSVTSQTSRDSIPPFPPPTSAEAHEALRQLAGLNEMPLERAEVAAADKPEPIYLNTPPLQKKPTKPQRSKKAAVREKKEEEVKRQQTASTLSDFERLHMNMSPPPLTSEAYENVDIAMKQTDGAEEDRAESTASSSTDTYDNVNITNRPSCINTDDLYDNVNITNKPMASNASVKTGEDLLSFVEPAAGAEAVRSPSPRLEFDARRPSGVKQNRTSKSINNKPISPLPSTTATTASGSSTSSSRPGSTLNESYEWNKIDNIFASLLEANPEEQLEISQHSRQPASIGDWLAQLGLSYYEAPFVASGYDDIRFMGGDVLEEDDLREIGIQNIDHIRTILEAASSLPSPPRIGDAEFPVPRSVKEWLTEINLADYEMKFLINSYDSMDRVRAIWEFELTTVIGIHFSGHRKRMIHSLGHRQQETREQVSWSQKFAAAEAPKTPKPATNDDAYDLHNQLLKDVVTGIEKRRYSRSDSKSPPVSESTNSSHPSSPRSPTSPTTPKYQPSFSWIHKPEKLLYDSALYITQYLGSHPVMVVRGTQSTLDACKKLSGTSKMLQKIPTIQLAISVRGIDFMDAQSHAVISSYDIRNISYCAQDPSDLTIYAYITKDTATGKHYCHVFKAKDLTVGDEIVLTIGQAFELAYHQHRVLVEGNKDRKENDVSSSKHAVQNRLHSTSDNEAASSPTSPPPMPKPFSQRKKES